MRSAVRTKCLQASNEVVVKAGLASAQCVASLVAGWLRKVPVAETMTASRPTTAGQQVSDLCVTTGSGKALVMHIQSGDWIGWKCIAPVHLFDLLGEGVEEGVGH